MQYPLISEYVDAVRSAEDNFDKLSHLRPVLDDDGNPVMSSGNFAVVFKMKDIDTGKLYAVKCFTKEQAGREEAYRQITDELEFVQSTYLAKVRYYDKELFVDTNSSDDSEFPVLLMDWVDGLTLDRYVRRNLNDRYALEVLAYNFSRLAMWLLPQPFAHGDLKPDNILVRSDGSLTLVDYDGMFVPAMQGQKSRELGSPDFRHPLRTVEDFNEHIDDFPVISILLSLRLVAADSSLLDKYGAADRLLFSESDYRDLSSCQLLKATFPSQNAEINILVGLFAIACGHKTLANVSFRLLATVKPQKPEVIEATTIEEELSTKVTDEDLKNAVVDEFGAKYSQDGRRLLRGTDVKVYKIRKGTIYICDRAFGDCSSLLSVFIPDSVTTIGDKAFYGCSSLQSVAISDSVTTIGDSAFWDCSSLQSVEISNSVTTIGDGTFSGCRSLRSVAIPNSVTTIGDSVFWDCSLLQSVEIPNSVTTIGYEAFSGCRSLQSVAIPDSVTTIGDSAFWGCSSLQSVEIPDSVTTIGDRAFTGCSSLQSVAISDSVTTIGDSAFLGCRSLQSVTIPDSVTTIGNKAFSGCRSLHTIKIPKGSRKHFEQLLPGYKLVEV